ncbi:MAG: hypothetical protein JJU18_05490 [Oceanicaulis sp.]|nr:hypothetical protein [Oceanicaulis sp.]
MTPYLKALASAMCVLGLTAAAPVAAAPAALVEADESDASGHFGSVRAPRLAPRREAARAPFAQSRVGFSLTVRGELVTDLAVFTVFARPGERITLETDQPVLWPGASEPARRHVWTAPSGPHLTTLSLEPEEGAAMALNLVTMRALSEAQDGVLNGYRIGAYPSEPFRGEPAYRAPEALVEVNSAMANLRITPHFTLGQFLCKQAHDGTPYVLVTEALLVKLEHILEAVNAEGWRVDTLGVMSGYRTPAYNRAIGNGANSRHVFGGAADIYIDLEGDGRMSDLNGDGVVDRRDAALLFDLIERLYGESPDFARHLGGLGEYGPTRFHGGFVHVDERGWRARWGRPAS